MENKNQENTWEHILDIFIRNIQKQTYNKDQKLPTENEMAAKYGCNRNEIRMVYKKLKEMGYIYSIRGCGSFFAGKRIKIPLSMNKGTSFSLKIQELGLDYRTENLNPHIIRYNSNIYEAMQAQKDDIIWKIVLLRIIDGKPVAIHTRYMNQQKFPYLADNATSIRSSHEYLRANGYQDICNADGQLAITPISNKKRLLLDMQHGQEAMVLTGKTLYAPDQSVLELFCTTYRPDRFLFTFD